MDQAVVMLGALQGSARLGSARLSAAEVEALAAAAGIDATAVPALVERLAEAKAVKLVWGGAVEVLPEPPAAAGGVYFDNRGATFGPGATQAGRDATGATITHNAGIALGELAAVLLALRALRPGLTGEAAEAATAAEQVLAGRPQPDAPVAERRSWAARARGALSALLRHVPGAEAIASLADRAVKAFSAG
jgi:hypothetical protein